MTTETLMTSGDNTQPAATTQPPAVVSTPETAATPPTTPDKVEDATPPADKPEGAPEKYEFKPIENAAAFDDAVIGAFSEVAKELNLTQDNAQKILDKVAPMMAARSAERFEATNQEWVAQATTDKEFGGDKLTENLAIAKSAMDKFATPELKELLNKTGLGNHPEFIRAFYRAGKAISEDKFVPGGDVTPTQSLAERLYGSTKK